VKRPEARLIAVDGIVGALITARAREVLSGVEPRLRGGVSVWDASGIFDEMIVAGPEAGSPSARTLLLLYAADLAFRLRWEIRPKLLEGRTVVVAPYVDTAVTFGRAAGISKGWLVDLFAFAPRPGTAHRVATTAPRRGRNDGFFEFACAQCTGGRDEKQRQQLTARAREYLRETRG
jgi:hypothetical protein